MAGKQPVAVVSDSALSLPKKLVHQEGIHCVPVELVFQGRVYRDGVDMEATEFYRLMARGSEMPTTTAPRPASYLEAFRQASIEAQGVLCLTLSSRFSASYSAAVAAAQLAKEELDAVSIHVLDSGTAASAQGFVALAAARAANQGASLQEVVEAAEGVKERVHLFAFLDTLYYLWRGGRVPRVAAWGTQILGIKPLLELSQGKVRLVARPRTRRRATERLIALVQSWWSGGPLHLAVMHAQAEAEALALRDKLRQTFPCQELLVGEFSPVMGTHTGPGLLGVAFYSEGPLEAPKGTPTSNRPGKRPRR